MDTEVSAGVDSMRCGVLAGRAVSCERRRLSPYVVSQREFFAGGDAELVLAGELGIFGGVC